MNPAQQKIESFFRQRYGRDAIFLPSGRLALYLAFREWLRPGERLLLSPVNDDVVFFTVLAAELVPVIAPLDPNTGNLCVDAIHDAEWKNISAVMTTNLYGIPDQMEPLLDVCRRHGLLLIEDACQALDTRVGGRLVGEFSSIAVFSLSKHIDGVGGVLTFTNTRRRSSLLARASKEISDAYSPVRARKDLNHVLRSVAEATDTLHVYRKISRRIQPKTLVRNGHRMEYVTNEVTEAQTTRLGLKGFERWLRTDNPNYRTAPSRLMLKSTMRHLERFEENRQRRIDGTRKLLQLGLTPEHISLPKDSALFRVPLFVKHREQVLRQLVQAQRTPADFKVGLDYIYDPPLDVYASPCLAERFPSPPGAEHWSQNVLPVNPLHADQFLTLLSRIDKVQLACPQSSPISEPRTVRQFASA